jgi:hypothetical protein
MHELIEFQVFQELTVFLVFLVFHALAMHSRIQTAVHSCCSCIIPQEFEEILEFQEFMWEFGAGNWTAGLPGLPWIIIYL